MIAAWLDNGFHFALVMYPTIVLACVVYAAWTAIRERRRHR